MIEILVVLRDTKTKMHTTTIGTVEVDAARVNTTDYESVASGGKKLVRQAMAGLTTKVDATNFNDES